MNQLLGLSLNAVRRGVLALTAAAFLLMAASGAKAGCGDLAKGPSPAIPWANATAKAAGQSEGDPTIVGLWHVIYTSDGKQFNETFKMWHADGIEFENAVLPPAGGNICYGVWKEVSRNTVKLHHVGLVFGGTNGALSNTFTIDEVNEVAEDNCSYKGTFTFKEYDTTGKLLVEIQGTQAATRITVD